MKYFILIFLGILFITGCNHQPEIEESEKIKILLDSLSNPWGMSFINNYSMLITQKSGELFYYDFKNLIKINSVPKVAVVGQGGLLDVHYDEGYIYLTYSAPGEGGFATHLGRGILNLEKFEIENFKVLSVIEPFISGGSHFGSRVITNEKYLYFTTGDRGSKDFSKNHPSQNTSNEIGTVIRLYKNGSVPNDNPFIEVEGFKNTIYTYGHRNIQGIALYNEDIWISEHGEQDGDMIHKLISGGNYGWPITHYGCTYVRGAPIGKNAHEKEDIINPIHYWECGSRGFPPAGMDFYKDRLFLGNLRGAYLAEFEFTNDGKLKEINQYLNGHRIRDVMAYENGVYVITDSGMLVKLKL